MSEKYNEVLDDILTLISSIKYEDKEKEFARAQLYYFLFKTCQTEEQMKDGCLILDRYSKGR